MSDQNIHISKTDDLETCLALRRVVFIEEQGVPEAEEVDEFDQTAVHLLAVAGGKPIGTARLVCEGSIGKIGRVCVLQDARGKGLGVALINAGVTELRDTDGIRTVKLGAQVHALGFYEKLGFHAVGPIYDDAGIPHRDMMLDLN